MCGIVGVIDYEGRYATDALRRLTATLRDDLAHRGPDDAGLWTSPDGRVCLGHRRLAILDRRPSGRQPMVNEDGRVAVTFNGEIYNFPSLRAELERTGHVFRSRTDTEVLCHLLEGNPDAAVERLSGMFAFGAWREAERELVLARDPFGKKPLYYLRDRDFLAFASELRPLERFGDRLGGVDPVAVQEYLLLQYIHAPRTIYRNVRKLEPGTLLTFRFDRQRLRTEERRRFFRFEPHEPWSWPRGRRRSLDDLAEELRLLLIESVKDRLVADVPVGAFLSGGNDSSLVVAVMACELGVRPRTFSAGFANWLASEHLAARQIAAHLGTDHHELLVEPNAIERLPDIVAALDEPNGDSSCLPTYLLSGFARREVTVALSGDGGDELFGGYGRYTETVREANSLRLRLGWLWRHRQWWTPGRAYLGDRILPMTAPVLRELVGRLAPEIEEMLSRWHADTDQRGPVLHRLRALDAESYLPGAVLAKVDRMAMHFALEVRCPLLDRRIAAWAAALPAWALNDGVETKKVLKRLARRYLPRELVERPKQGFGLPDAVWSQDRLLDRADDLLLGAGAKLGDYLNRHQLRNHLSRQRDACRFNVYQVWELLILEVWLRGRALPAAAAA